MIKGNNIWIKELRAFKGRFRAFFGKIVRFNGIITKNMLRKKCIQMR